MATPPLYILFAGVNGAGKSTLFRSGLWCSSGLERDLPRVNPDEIIAENGWDWREESAQLKAGRLAVERLRGLLEAGASFNQETTLTDKTVMRNIERARQAGYHIALFYIGVDDPSIASERVARRVESGGHFIPADVVTRRYDASLDNLVRAIPLCDEVYLYDNTRLLELEARFAHGELLYCGVPALEHPWLKRTLGALGYVEVSLAK
ncbi:MAG: zeta toxin family protein [Coriobacteriales bacterium]|jgi:predicted ABC-type ATPase